jgi:hypothetical protein
MGDSVSEGTIADIAKKPGTPLHFTSSEWLEWGRARAWAAGLAPPPPVGVLLDSCAAAPDLA